jgi:hypothetical protein
MLAPWWREARIPSVLELNRKVRPLFHFQNKGYFLFLHLTVPRGALDKTLLPVASISRWATQVQRQNYARCSLSCIMWLVPQREPYAPPPGVPTRNTVPSPPPVSGFYTLLLLGSRGLRMGVIPHFLSLDHRRLVRSRFGEMESRLLSHAGMATGTQAEGYRKTIGRFLVFSERSCPFSQSC